MGTKKPYWNLIIGILIILLNLYWIYDNVNLYYLYHYTQIDFFIMIPDWVLLINTILGAIGIFIGARVILQKITIKKAIKIELVLILFGGFLDWAGVELF